MMALISAWIVLLLDQASKVWVRRQFALGESVTVIPNFLDFTYARNTGAAWSMLSGHNGVLSMVALCLLVLMFVFRRRIFSDTWEHRLAAGLMTGGVIGNLIDRIKLGYVTDFIDCYAGTWHWPTFNVADASICIAVGIYMVSSLWLRDHPMRESAEKDISSPTTHV